MLSKGVYAHTSADVPDLRCAIKGAREDLIAFSVKVEAHDFACMVL